MTAELWLECRILRDWKQPDAIGNVSRRVRVAEFRRLVFGAATYLTNGIVFLHEFMHIHTADIYLTLIDAKSDLWWLYMRFDTSRTGFTRMRFYTIHSAFKRLAALFVIGCV